MPILSEMNEFWSYLLYNKVNEGEIKIIYSEEFFNNKIFRELTINGLKICAVFLMYASIVILGSS